jgi:hypothetical protein
LFVAVAILSGAKRCVKEAKSGIFTSLRSVQNAKSAFNGLLKKEKG